MQIPTEHFGYKYKTVQRVSRKIKYRTSRDIEWMNNQFTFPDCMKQIRLLAD